MSAKKSLGQHFLKSDAVARQIVDSIQYKDADHILEVGPGPGILTKFLYEVYTSRLSVVEMDNRMIDPLKEAYPEATIIHADFLKLNLGDSLQGETVLIGNFPYNISSQIVFRLLENRSLFPEMVGMFQKEVADRILSPHGKKSYGILSVLVQSYYEGKQLIKLEPGAFSPPPKVRSAVIRLQRKQLETPSCNGVLLKKVVKQAFNQRRKMLRNSLKPIIGDAELPGLNRRPEQLSVEDFHELTNQIEQIT